MSWAPRAALAALILVSACDDRPVMAIVVEGGDPERGEVAVRAFGCGTCHRVAGIAGADGTVGPPLDGLARQAYIAGVLPNTPENMIRWIQHPREIDPRTAMPDVGVTEEQARDIAAFLYMLEER